MQGLKSLGQGKSILMILNFQHLFIKKMDKFFLIVLLDLVNIRTDNFNYIICYLFNQ